MPTISYENIGGLKRQLDRIREIVELSLKYPELFEHWLALVEEARSAAASGGLLRLSLRRLYYLWHHHLLAVQLTAKPCKINYP